MFSFQAAGQLQRDQDRWGLSQRGCSAPPSPRNSDKAPLCRFPDSYSGFTTPTGQSGQPSWPTETPRLAPLVCPPQLAVRLARGRKYNIEDFRTVTPARDSFRQSCSSLEESPTPWCPHISTALAFSFPTDLHSSPVRLFNQNALSTHSITT